MEMVFTGGINMAILDVRKITELREKKGWSQKDLAEATQISTSAISRLEKGMQTDFKFSLILSVAVALGVTIDELLIHARKNSTSRIIPELQSVLNQLSEQPEPIQQQVVGIIRGYLSTIRSYD